MISFLQTWQICEQAAGGNLTLIMTLTVCPSSEVPAGFMTHNILWWMVV
jgi:hypothetical protein